MSDHHARTAIGSVGDHLPAKRCRLLRMNSDVVQPFAFRESRDPQAVTVGSQLSPETLAQLTGSLHAHLACELRTAGNQMEPSGAVDYNSTFYVDWFPGEIDTEPDEAVLAAARA